MRLFAAILALASAVTPAAEAASIQVSPVTLQINEPALATHLTVRNGSDDPAHVQVRAYRWTQVDGEDRLERATDLAVSPPATVVAGGGENLVRIVRLQKAPVAREESYRVLVDQLPDAAAQGGVTLKILMRYSIPVFVSPRRQMPSELAWSAVRDGDSLVLTATNTGGRRVRISSLSVIEDAGAGSLERSGLVGYVLAGGTKSWSYPVSGSQFRHGASLRISGSGDDGDFNAAIQITQK